MHTAPEYEQYEQDTHLFLINYILGLFSNYYYILIMRQLFIILFLIFSPPVVAEENKSNTPRIQVNAILNNAAVLTINGKQQMLSKNALSAEGYKLTRIDVDKVTLLIRGVPLEFKLGAAITSSKTSASNKRSISIKSDSRGMYFSNGQINSYPVQFLIDTGATSVAINSTLANKIGIDYLAKGVAQKAQTASGIVTAYQLVLNDVSIGDLKLFLVDAMVIEGDFPITPLLGMSFLQRVKFNDDGMLLNLEEKF